jgi:hypothetical protein
VIANQNSRRLVVLRTDAAGALEFESEVEVADPPTFVCVV